MSGLDFIIHHDNKKVFSVTINDEVEEDYSRELKTFLDQLYKQLKNVYHIEVKLNFINSQLVPVKLFIQVNEKFDLDRFLNKHDNARVKLDNYIKLSRLKRYMTSNFKDEDGVYNLFVSYLKRLKVFG